MLYTSSKAALHNLYQAAKEKFKNSNIKIKFFIHQDLIQIIKELKNKGNVKNINIIAKDLLKK